MTLKIKNGAWRLFSLVVLAGTAGSPSKPNNRISILSNILGLSGILGAALICYQLLDWGIEGPVVPTYLSLCIAAALVIVLNAIGRPFASRVFTVLLLNITAWNALIFYGKTFNGYLIFFAAVIYSAIAFDSRQLIARWSSLAISLAGLPLADVLSHRGILPITNFNSAQAPIGVLISDTVIVSTIVVSMILIEKFLSEANEKALKLLNENLEEIVLERTTLLMEAKEDALAASQAKSYFIANTSHELRTPLGAIIGFVDLVLNAKPAEADTHHYLEIVRRNADQLLHMVDEILDLSKIEAQKLKIEKASVALRGILQEVRSLVQLKAEAKGLDLRIEEGSELPEQIFTDPLRLKQILSNLIGNSIKFTEKGSVVLKVSALDDGHGANKLHFDICDTGPGISQAGKISIFQPFFQGDSSSVRKHGGAGLGLSLSKKLAGLLGGDLVLMESKIGEGSTFRLTLDGTAVIPVRATSENRSSSFDSTQLAKRKILIVDDSPDNQYLIRQYLILSGANVEVANNGKEALDKIATCGSYSAVLMDLQMPIMDGYEATRILRERGCTIPIIAFTAHAMKNELHKLHDSGFTDYLTKPVQRQRLISLLAEENGAVP